MIIIDLAIKAGTIAALLAQIGALAATLFTAIAAATGTTLTAGMIASLNKMLAWLAGAAIALGAAANTDTILELVDTALCKAKGSALAFSAELAHYR